MDKKRTGRGLAMTFVSLVPFGSNELVAEKEVWLASYERLCLNPTPKRGFGGAPKQAALLLFSVAVLLAGGAAAVRGQSALDGFDPNANGIIHAVVVQPDGKILIGGDFTTLSPNGGAAVTRNYIARLNPDGTLDTAFNPNASGEVAAIAVQADGKVLAGGSFTSIGGQTRYFLARLDATTGAADSFNPNPNSDVAAIAVQVDGKILVGGKFNGSLSVGEQTRSFFARLSNDTAALQNLGVTPTAIAWTRSGSSPQFTRVTFESSTDNVNYTPLGNGTATGSNWALTSLSLPTGQNIYIRARGYYSSGLENGSESITESVRNAFLTPQPLLNIQPIGNSNVVLSWPTNFTGFTLEASTNLATNVWSTVSPAPSVSGTNNVVTNAISGSRRFYRLSQ